MNSPAAAKRRSGDRGKLWAVVAVTALSAVLFVAWRRSWLSGLLDHEQLITWMRDHGAVGPLICIGIQFMQVVIFAIPGEITQIAAGYVFGAWWGFLYSIVGILFGSAFDFGFAKAVGRPAVQRILGSERLADIDERLRSRNGLVAVFVLFLLPGTPKDAMSYGAGLTALRLPMFLALSVPARMPALLLSTLFGSEAHDGDYSSMVWIAVTAGLLLGGAAFFQWRRRAR